MNAEGSNRKVLINEKGPLPITREVIPMGNTKETIFISGSCFSDTANRQIGFELYAAGELVGSSVIFSNGTLEHRATVPVLIDYNLPFVIKDGNVQPVELELRPMEGTATDANDVFNLTLMM